MRILYGVVGEGTGHATRSRVVIERLVARGHEVGVVASAKAEAYLGRFMAGSPARGRVEIVPIRGLSLRYGDEGIDRAATVAHNLAGAPDLVLRNAAAYFDLVGSFRPDLVFSDFDSFAYLFAKQTGVPVVSIDNIQMLARCKQPDWVKKGAKVAFQLTKAFVKAKLPRCDRYVVTSFFFPPIKKKQVKVTTLVPPILREAIIDAKAAAEHGDHVLVYQTGHTSGALLDRLRRLTRERFVVYGGARRETLGNCEIMPFDEVGFVRDLASAKAVVANGGFSLMSEAVYLGKPVYAVPVRHQFEQELNARWLQGLGYGASARDWDGLEAFLDRRVYFTHNLRRHEQDGNEHLYDVLDEIVGGAAERRSTTRVKAVVSRSASAL
jgi:uncharacterized protein (TIGR00661 family)